ncbi:hypothetical protein L208DRAFT_1439127 [Tricholoma matsutake]|nr:hypothetical protein L208DRAFT_1439127 [Tricholoma matsutake 945]
MASGSRQRVLVSFSPQSILSTLKWQQVQTALAAQLPLHNIHWKSASRRSIRTIQELEVGLVSLETVRDEYSQIPTTLLEKPLLNIYVVVCPNTDVDGYRTTVKKQIKDWHSAVTTRKYQEWLILHIIKSDAQAPSGKFFQKNSVFEKIRADFNVEKRERCAQVAWSSETDNPAVWAEVMNKIKDGILSAFDAAISQREDELKRSEGQRHMPGWNFCTFFILKESLAISFEGVHLFEDAYAQYDELEGLFHEVLKEKNLSWFGPLINRVNGDDSAPLLSSSKKPYRDLILANSISVFDFRTYVLSRQCELLAQKGRITDISRKVATFLCAFGRRLREVETSLPPFFVESWIYSSALSVVEQCDFWSSGFSIVGPKLNAFNAAKGELMELARSQLDTIGIAVGHIPPRPPFSATSSPFIPSQTKAAEQITNTDILSSIESVDSFYELYVTTTNRAIDMYTQAGRRKFALRLHGSLAALDLHRGQLNNALTTYSSLPAHYAPHMWTSLESFMLSQALDTHAKFNKDKDTEWIHVLLSYLRTYIDTQGTELLLHEADKVVYVTELVNELKTVVSELKTDIAHPDHPAVSIEVSTNARIAETEDGCYLDVTILNRLPCILPADEVSVVILGRDSERAMFSLPVQDLAPGKTRLTMFCPISAAGTYVFESSEVRLARLLLQRTHWQAPASKGVRYQKDSRPVLVRVPKDLLALDVQLSLPNRIELGEAQTLLFAVSSGRNHVSRITFKLSSSGVIFRLKDAYLHGDSKSAAIEITTAGISLSDIPKDTAVSVMVPYSNTPGFHAMKIHVTAEYTTASEPLLSRAFAITRVVLTTLPISVNVEDFFRGNRLFSKFTISTTSHQHVRIASAHLNIPEDGLDGVKIVTPSTKNRPVVTVTPSQPVNFICYIESANGPVREPLNFLIRYRILREEVEFVVESVVAKVLADSPSTNHHRVTLVNMLVKALEHDAGWVEMYGITGELNVPGTAQEEKEDDLHQLLDKAKELLQAHRHPYPPEGNWREIVIPVDVPYMNIVAAARIRILSTPFAETSTLKPLPLYAGQPISALLTINTSFRWGTSANDKERQYMLRYDVEELVKDWLVSGRKRGDFAATDGATYSVPITLIALHHGELALPKVSVVALAVAGELTMGAEAIPSTETYQVHGAEKVLVLPRGGRSTFIIGMGSKP